MDEFQPKPISPTFWAAVIAIPIVVVIGLIWALTHPQDLMFLNSKQAIDIGFQVPGEPVARSLSQFRGRVLAVTIWDPDCLDCQSEIGTLNDLAHRFGRDGLMCVALTAADAEAIRRYATLKNMDVLAGVVDHGQAQVLPAGRPYTYLIDREGFARMQFQGVRSTEKLEKTVQKLLEQE